MFDFRAALLAAPSQSSIDSINSQELARKRLLNISANKIFTHNRKKHQTISRAKAPSPTISPPAKRSKSSPPARTSTKFSVKPNRDAFSVPNVEDSSDTFALLAISNSQSKSSTAISFDSSFSAQGHTSLMLPPIPACKPIPHISPSKVFRALNNKNASSLVSFQPQKSNSSLVVPQYPKGNKSTSKLQPLSIPVTADWFQGLEIVKSAIQNNSVAPPTFVSYTSLLSNNCMRIEQEYNAQLTAKARSAGVAPPSVPWRTLPLDTEDKIKTVFAVFLGSPKVHASYLDKDCPNGPKVRYSSFQSLKSAFRLYHIVNNIPTPLTNPSAHLAQWLKGIKNSTSHSTRSKFPISESITFNYLRKAYDVIQRYHTSDLSDKALISDSAGLAIIRRAAILSVGYFGVRRNSETHIIKTTDLDDRKLYHILKINFAKNDQQGKGHITIIPSIAALQAHPYIILYCWLKLRSLFLSYHQIVDSGFVFINIDGSLLKSKGRLISADTLTKDIKNIVTTMVPTFDTKNTISLRKGGSQFYCAADPSKRSTAHYLGGWKTGSSLLDSTYSPISPEELAAVTITQSHQGAAIWLVQTQLSKLERTFSDKGSTSSAPLTAFNNAAKYHKFLNITQLRTLAPSISRNFAEAARRDHRLSVLSFLR